jgi:hypothetical protein
MKYLIVLTIVFIGISAKAQEKEKSYKVLAACGTCQFNMSSPTGCALAIKVAGKTYWVDGSALADHGDEHAEDGMCKIVKKVVTTGVFLDNRFKASSFTLISDKKKKGEK